MELKQQGVRLPDNRPGGVTYAYHDRGAQPLSWENEPMEEGFGDQGDFAEYEQPRAQLFSWNPNQTARRITDRARGYVRAGRARFAKRGGKNPDGQRPVAFFTTLGGQVAVCTAIILCALVLRSIDTPATQAVTAGVKDAVTMEVDLDQSLGRLKFVQNLFPDTVAVLSQEKAPTELQPPFNGKVTGKFTLAMPGIEITGGNQNVYACYEGKVVLSSRQDDGAWMVEIEHTGGLKTVYARMAGASVTVGDRVTKGEQIGVAGGSGEDYQMFLQIQLDGVAIDPLTYFQKD